MHLQANSPPTCRIADDGKGRGLGASEATGHCTEKASGEPCLVIPDPLCAHRFEKAGEMAMEPCMRDMHPEDPSRSFCTVWRETDPEVCGPMCMVSSCDWYVLPPPRHDSHTRCPTLSDLSAARCTGARGVLAAVRSMRAYDPARSSLPCP